MALVTGEAVQTAGVSGEAVEMAEEEGEEGVQVQETVEAEMAEAEARGAILVAARVEHCMGCCMPVATKHRRCRRLPSWQTTGKGCRPTVPTSRRQLQ